VNFGVKWWLGFGGGGYIRVGFEDKGYIRVRV
jgi:hypothetical protein